MGVEGARQWSVYSDWKLRAEPLIGYPILCFLYPCERLIHSCPPLYGLWDLSLGTVPASLSDLGTKFISCHFDIRLKNINIKE